MIELENPNEIKEQPKVTEPNQDTNTLELIPEGYSQLKELPSKFIPYNTDKIYVRPFKMGELEYLSDMKKFDLLKFVSIIKNLVKGVDILEMTALDLKVALVYSLILSEDTGGWNLSNTCEYCGHHFNHKLKVDQIVFEDLNVAQLPLTVDYEGLSDWTFDVLRIKHLININDFLSKHTSDESFNNKLLFLSEVSNQKDKSAAYKYLYNLPTSAKDAVNYLANNIVQSIQPIKVKCPNPALYVTLTKEDQINDLLNKFASVNQIQEKIYLPADSELRQAILKYMKDNKFEFKTYPCEHIQDRDIALDFSHLYP
nr:MAG TPA: hypothetical protein [Bacteriophage sp.]